MVVTINVHNSYINSASLGTSGTSGVIAGVITALLIFVVLAGLALFYVMNKVSFLNSEPKCPFLSNLSDILLNFLLYLFPCLPLPYFPLPPVSQLVFTFAIAHLFPAI